MINRDATKQARGFSYQRKYAILLFCESIGTQITSIIEEGNIDDCVYEDITLMNNTDNEYITYQIKYHTGKMSFNRSNSDLFKTIKNKNNLQDKVKKILFIVSKNTNTFDEFLTKWKDKKITGEDIYNNIIDLDETGDEAKVKSYKECKLFFKDNSCEDIINYLNKIYIEEGLPYGDLDKKIDMVIQDKFNITDKQTIFFIKYSIFERFDTNWFKEKNVPLEIDDIYNDITTELPKISENITTMQNNIFNILIRKVHNFLLIQDDTINLDEQTENIILELNEIIKIYTQLEMKEYISLLNLLSKINQKKTTVEITKLYNIIKKKLCKSLLIKYTNINTSDNKIDDRIDDILASISYYYNHSIKNMVAIDKSHLKWILT